MGYLERRIERLEDCLDFSMQRNGSAFNHMEMREELRELRSELRYRREMGYGDYDDDIETDKDSEKYEKKQSVMQRIFDCFERKSNSNHYN